MFYNFLKKSIGKNAIKVIIKIKKWFMVIPIHGKNICKNIFSLTGDKMAYHYIMTYLGTYLKNSRQSQSRNNYLFIVNACLSILSLNQCPLGSRFIQNINASFIYVYEY